jgi:hypothetical protein
MSENSNSIYSNFEVEVKEVNSILGGPQTIHTLIFRRDMDPELVKTLTDLLDTDEVYNDPIKLSPTELYPFLKDIQSKIEQSGQYNLIELSYWLNEHFKDKIQQLERMNSDGKINFANLEQLFKVGTKSIGYIYDQPIGFIVNKTDRSVDSFGMPVFLITGKITVSRGDKFIQFDKTFSINSFGGAQFIKNLPIRPISDEELKMLTDRGRKYVKYALSANYVQYSGYMFKKTMYGLHKFKADGRIMIDPTGFSKKNPGYFNYRGVAECESVPEDLMFMCYPFTCGFNFNTKDWGELLIDNISDINFDNNAFDLVVLDESIKSMVKALVVNSTGTFSDIITGKSGGTIICLNGPPGVGKTILAQSISELLHKPLYSIGSGELGINAKELEAKLAEILEIAHAWDAIILIDEADIFMEKRSTNDLVRNSMVSVFLRLLENYQGIMFLTTNRPEHFDEAFKSRIGINIGYNELNEESRFKIWTNLLKASNVNISIEDIEKLSKTQMNGRQIKNCIRMGQCLAKESKEELSRQIIEKVIPFVI